jgi:hypothetical protein
MVKPDLEPELSSRRWWQYTGVWVALAAIALLVGLAAGVGFGWRAAMEQTLVSSSCVPLERVDLEVAEIVDLKQRWRSYSRDPGSEAHLEVSPREATFLLRGESALGVWLGAEGDHLLAKVTVPQEGGCYNVEYQGKLEISDGMALLDVEQLRVGHTDLTELAGLGGAIGGARQAVRPEDVEDPTLKAQLANIRHLEVREGKIRVRFVDPERVWR